MSLYDLILIPILFGLVGFFEPCSLGANIIFLNRVNQSGKTKRVLEAILFTTVRGVFLALIGLTGAFIGNKIITIQSNIFIILGIIYIILGIISITNIYHPIFKHEINFGKYLKNKGPVALGIIFGLVIPACAIGFVVALIGRAVLVENLFGGFISLLIFGITLSVPMIPIAYFEKSNKIIQKIHNKVKDVKWLPGIILILIGILTMLSSIWWANA